MWQTLGLAMLKGGGGAENVLPFKRSTESFTLSQDRSGGRAQQISDLLFSAL